MMGITFYYDFGSFLGLSLSELSFIRIPFISGRSGATRPGTTKKIDLEETRSKNQYVPYGHRSNVNDWIPTVTDLNNSEDSSLMAIWQSLSPEEKMAQFAYEGSTRPYFTSFVPSSITTTTSISPNTRSELTQLEDHSNLDSGNSTPTLSSGISSSSSTSTSTLCTPDTSPTSTTHPTGSERMNALFDDDDVGIEKMISLLTSDVNITQDQRSTMADTVKCYRRHDELMLWVDREGQDRGVKLILEEGRRRWAIWKEV
ncbi:hypothetical protein L486_03248 [Kwoniella mangroviensis CBS 10435]|uniref:Uncharacterized protein n=1 Tax=Kwoniella mangroviensis CBS 10435 TaxID=1331196 RepID=A0A1B9IT89_9TREE|nr:hypothetical protein L486_03248 [Kwoniella mangroviensis CBS 10435]